MWVGAMPAREAKLGRRENVEPALPDAAKGRIASLL